MILFVIATTDPVEGEADLLRALRASRPGDRVRHPTDLLPPAVVAHALVVLAAEGRGATVSEILLDDPTAPPAVPHG